MIKQILVCILLVSLCVAQVSYTVDTRQVKKKSVGETNKKFANQLKKDVEAAPQPDGYCKKENPPFPLENSEMCGSNKQLGWIITLEFKIDTPTHYEIQFGTDFGYGYAIFINDKFYSAKMKDCWWDGDWSSDAVFKMKQDFEANQPHKITIYGSDGCCDGLMDLRFKVNKAGPWKNFHLENLQEAMPEPKAVVEKVVEEKVPETEIKVEEKPQEVVQKEEEKVEEKPKEEAEEEQVEQQAEEEEEEEEPKNVYHPRVQVESRYGTGTMPGTDLAFAQALKAQFENSDYKVGYCEQNPAVFPLKNQMMCPAGAKEDILWLFNFEFRDIEAAEWDFQFGTDFGRGMAVYVDHVFYESRQDDMWWAGNWDSDAVFSIKKTFEKGSHHIQVYGSEQCCDGDFDVRFSKNGSEYKTLNHDNILAAIDPDFECAIVYEQCDYQGKPQEICTKTADLKQKIVKSVKVPVGKYLTIWQEINFEGKMVTFNESVDCMEGVDYTDAAFLLAHKIEVHDLKEESSKNNDKTQTSFLMSAADLEKKHNKKEKHLRRNGQ